jgi:hypothetical protein
LSRSATHVAFWTPGHAAAATAVFGCAGLRSLLDAPLPVAPGTRAGFMFGELVTLAGRPRFGNLMAARLTPEP